MRARQLSRWLLAGLIFTLSAAAGAQTCGLPGWDGPVTPVGIINTYHAGSNSPGAGSSSINVASIAGQRTNTRSLRAGDLILIMQMQDSASPATAGQHEYAQITAVAGTTLQLNRTLTNSYTRNMGNAVVRNWQVVWVPQYSSATISGTVSADFWRITPGLGAGSGDATGGVVAIDVAGALAITGTISVAGTGFRGGAGLNGVGTRTGAYTDTDYAFTTTAARMSGAIKGEGIEGTPLNVFDGTATPLDYFSLLGQGYAAGAAGRGARSNAGGAGNDGDPPGVTYPGNQLNSGGGGGSNAGGGGRGGNAWNQNTTGGAFNLPAAGNTGNAAGGLGGNGQANTATRLVMGGGGGAGTANNGSASSISSWPPAAVAPPPAVQVANGGQGSITSSGASGGGIVLIRAGSFSATAGVINADGYRAYNKSPAPGETDSAGGGGGGGSVSIRSVAGNGAGLTINANGGVGGSSLYYNHGPGGGGGGGYVLTSFTGSAVNVAGGLNGTDGCCGGTAGNGSPKPYNATVGNIGSALTSDGTPAGVTSGASCLPVVNVIKSTVTPLITTATGASATYLINLSNTGGAASNVFVFDASLPPGWLYTSAPASTYTYSPAPPPGAASNAAGAENPTAVLPAGFPASVATSVNSGAAVALATTPGTVPTTGANTLTFGSFYLPQNSNITISFAVTIPNQATAGTYHNPAGVVFLDPTRTVAGNRRMVSPLVNVTANRSSTAYSANTTYETGATTTVLGTNSSGLVAGPTTENVTLLPDLSVTKTSSTPTFTVGAAGLQYVIVGRNNGRPVANQVYLTTQATDASATTIVSPTLSIADSLPAGMTLTAITTNGGPTWACTPNGTSTTFTCSAGSAVYPLPAATNLVTVTATVAVSAGACPGPQVNTTTFTVAALGDSIPANNTATASTTTGCSANLTVTKTNNVNSVTAGGTTSYTVTFANLGPAAADNASVKDTAGTGLVCTVASCTPAGGAVCPVVGQLPNLLTSGLTLSSMPSGSTAAFVVNCNVTATGQ